MLTRVADIYCGVISGAAFWKASLPADAVKSNIQSKVGRERISFFTAASEIRRSGGLKAVKGFLARYVILHACISVFEALASFVFAQFQHMKSHSTRMKFSHKPNTFLFLIPSSSLITDAGYLVVLVRALPVNAGAFSAYEAVAYLAAP
jgi:hypothetical protein